MRESRTYGSVRGALSNGRPYRVCGRHAPLLHLLTAGIGTSRQLATCSNTSGVGGEGDMRLSQLICIKVSAPRPIEN